MTLHHPHGQIYAYPYVTPRAARPGRRRRPIRTTPADGYADRHPARERTDGSRMVLEGEHFSAFVPFAARWPIEVHMVPHRQVPDLAALPGAERDELAVLYPRLLRRHRRALRQPRPRTSPPGTRPRWTPAMRRPATCTCS